MNQQEIFDTVADHLFTQGKPAVTDSGACKYRLGDLKCAVGVLIPDELYNPKMEGRAIYALLSGAGEDSYSLPPEVVRYPNLLSHLQRVHDGNWQSQKQKKWPPGYLNERLTAVAADFDLTFTPR